MEDWRDLPDIRKDDPLLWQDTGCTPEADGIVPCLLCAKPFKMPPYVGEPDQVCESCRSEYGDCAIVRCVNCTKTPAIARLAPQKMDSGFVVRPRAVLHVDACNICKPGLSKSTIIEVANWERLLRPGKPTVVVDGRRDSHAG